MTAGIILVVAIASEYVIDIKVHLGTGSFGAAIGQVMIPSIQAVFGWEFVFYGFIVMVLCTSACLTPLLYRELKWRRRGSYVSLTSDSGSEDEAEIAGEEVTRRRTVVGDGLI
ncbi:unnamed protein product [Cylicostephanus goldi]|uniref:Major facilitator superfamily (MFS) profile domain-containing protein n=1 Tax=Cylicostephanus goldi TaxID=71465 RepID=A0A3P7ML06_CYLGO|nr:unnamed protein product [Cylicostephanus goldi]